MDESARIRSGRKLLQQVRAIHSRYKMSHTKEAGVLETEMQSQSKAGAGQKTVRDRSSELFNVLFSVGNYQLTKASLEHLLAKPEVQMLRENSDRKDKNRKRAANQMEGRDAEALDMVMGSFQKFFTSLLSDPGGKRRKGRLDDESRNAFYAAAAALIPADFMDKRMGRSLERLTNIPRKMLPKVAAIKKVGSAEGAGCKQAMPLWMQCGWTAWTRRTCGTSTSVEKRAMTKSSSCIWTCSLGSRACGRGHIPITAGWLAAASCSP